MAEIAYKPIPKAAEYPYDQSISPLKLGLRPGFLLMLAALLIACILLVLAWGSVRIPLDQIVVVLLGGEADRPTWADIILKVRLPKAITALLAGAALGASGLMMQTFFRNPLADPFVLGVSSGASLGVALVVLAAGTGGGALLAGIGLAGDILLAGAAALGAGLTMLAVLAAASRFQDSLALLILGLMCGYLVSAMVSLLLYFAVPERIQAYINWTFGSFGATTWTQIPVLAGAVLPSLIAALALTKPLNALLLGETYARSLGIDMRLTRIAIVAATGMLAGAVTAFCGPIGFIGIAAPHLCRSLFRTSDHRILMPSSILMGAVVTLIAAFIAEVPGNNLVLPLNAVMALIGAPVVIVVIVRQRSLQRSFTT